MNDKQLEALREWVRSEIDYSLELQNEFGYRDGAYVERDAAEEAFDKLKSMFN